MSEPRLIEREVKIAVSEDTMALWDEMARHMKLSFDALCQVLCLYGAYLLASADLGYLEGIGITDLTPQRIHPVIKQWLEEKVGPKP